MQVASRISPAFRESFGSRTFTAPSAATNSMRAFAGAARVVERSLEKKSSAPIVATLVRDSGDHLPIE